MVNNLLAIVDDLLYCINVISFTDKEKEYILAVIGKVVNFIEDST